MFLQILVLLDGSNTAEQSLKTAHRLAKTTGATLHMMRVIVATGYLGPTPLVPEPLIMEDTESEQAKARAYLEGLAQTISDISPMIHVIESNDVVQAILSFIDTTSIDLLLFTSHGYSPLEQWVMGHIAQKLARLSPIPTLVLHEQEQSYELPDHVNMVVALDGSSLAEEAIQPAVELLKALTVAGNGLLHLVQVVPTQTSVGIDMYESLALSKALSYLEQIKQSLEKEKLPFPFLATPFLTTESDIATALLSLLEHGFPEENRPPSAPSHYDMIAITTHGQSGFKRLFVGSVAEQLLSRSSVPLFVMHPSR